MSFLGDIKQFSKNKLKSTETHVMTTDGRRLIEKTDDQGVRTCEYVEGTGLGFVGDYKPDVQIGHILPGLLLSSQDVAADLELLKKHKVSHILNLAVLCENKYEDLFVYKSLDILDLPTEDITKYFEECFAFINDALNIKNNCILVHCNAGVSRAASIVIAYVMTKKNCTYEEAFSFVKSKRPSVRPNDGFIKQLKEYNTKQV